MLNSRFKCLQNQDGSVKMSMDLLICRREM